MTLAKLVKTVVAALEEIKARDVEVLDVTKMTDLFDRMIIASGDSTRQTKAIANNVQEKVKAGGGMVYGMEGEETGEWVLVDLGNVLVHVMQTAVRAHYNLEELWAEAKKVNRTTSDTGKSKAGIKPRIAKPRGASAKSISTPQKTKSSKRDDASE
jgi:ribosome-associated protein